MNQTLSAPATFPWPKAAWLTAVALAVLFALYWPTFYSMVEIWERSETFTHGFLIFPISAWLIWGRRHHLAAIEPRPDWRGIVLLGLAGAGWLLADAGSVKVVAQYAFIAMLIAAVWSLLGWAIVWALFFPLMFLFFAVPVGEFLIPPLIEFTANFTVAALQLTGIPVFREGTRFSIPSGDWSVVEACSGLRYLIASVTLGTLYAYLTYRSWRRRVVFTLLSIGIPLLANGLRAYMIVMIAHVSGMKYAVGADHLIYGWVFFGLVMLILFWIGNYWREDEAASEKTSDALTQRLAASRDALSSGWQQAALGFLLAAVVWPAYSAYLSQRSLPELPPLRLEAGLGWQPGEKMTDWVPHWIGADRELHATYHHGADRVAVFLYYYATQRQDAELINSQNLLVKEAPDATWQVVSETVMPVSINGKMRPVRQAELKSTGGEGRRLLVWQWQFVNGRYVTSDHVAKLVLALERVGLKRDDGSAVILAAPYHDKPDESTSMLRRFLEDNETAIAQALAWMSAK